MRTRFGVVPMAFALVALAALSPAVQAYDLKGAGGRLGFTSPENVDGTMMVGGHVDLERSDTRLHLLPNLMYWKSDGLSDLNPNFDVYYHFGREGRPAPYLGGGLGVNMRHSDRTDRTDNDLGANLLGGFQFPGQNNHWFVEGRYTASDVSQVALLAGITFRPGGSSMASLQDRDAP